MQSSSTLIFVNSSQEADSLERFLTLQGFPAAAIHECRSQDEGQVALRGFKNDETPYLVAATHGALRGNGPTTAHVINYELQHNIGDFINDYAYRHYYGDGLVNSFVTNKDATLASDLLRLRTESNQDNISQAGSKQWQN